MYEKRVKHEKITEESKCKNVKNAPLCFAFFLNRHTNY